MSEHARFLAYVLRHGPEEVGLCLRPGGWLSVRELLLAFRRHGRRMTESDLQTIVRNDGKRRFTLSPDGQHIRAAQGHTIPVDLQLPNVEPPTTLYHGTARDTLNAIFLDGLKPMRRIHVHLSAEIETAAKVGNRHGKEVILSIPAAKMFADGYAFYRADNGVWLTDHVPAQYLSFAERPI